MRTIAFVASAVLGTAMPAAAATMTATGVGVVHTGTDQTGIFGVGTDLVGQIAKMTFVYDTEALPNRYTYADEYLAMDSASGTFSERVFSLVTLEIGETVYTLEGTYNESANIQRDLTGEGTYYDLYSLASQYYIDTENGFENNAFNLTMYDLPLGASSLEDSFSWSGADVWFHLATYDFGSNTYVVDTRGQFNLQSLVVSSDAVSPEPLPPVPLPAAAPLLLAGIGAMLALSKRRRTNAK